MHECCARDCTSASTAARLAALAFLAGIAAASAEDPAHKPVDTIPVEPLETNPASPEHGATELEPIIVSANKREQALRELPGSVGALTGTTLEQLGAKNFEDYLKLVPGVSLNKEANDRADPSIRGIATETRFQSTQRTIGVYIDDIPMSDPFIPISQPDLAPFDLDRVEILKGPQGTLFGSTALAGAIRYIPHKPAPGRFESQVCGALAQVAQGDRQPFGAGMLNVPLGESAALRGVTVYRNEPAYIDDTRNGVADIGGVRKRQSRVQGSWLATDRLALSATYLQQASRQDDLPFADQTERLEHSDTTGPSPTRSAFAVANLVGTYDFDSLRVLSSTSRLTKAANLAIEASRLLGTTNAGTPAYQTADTDAHGVTQELRLSSLAEGPWIWVAGVWYLRYNFRYDQHFPDPASPNSGGESSEIAYGHFRSVGTEKAVFGELTRELWERWDVTLGGRYFDTLLHSHNVTGGVLVSSTSNGAEKVNDTDLVDKGFNPRISTSYRFNDHLLLHALGSKGFRFGGIQLSPPTDANTLTAPLGNTFKSDTLWNYEGGARTDWFNRRLEADATLFFEKWKDLQVTVTDSTGQFNFVANIGSAHTQGIEASLRARPFEDVTLTSSAAWIEARTDEDFQTASGNVPANSHLPGTPPFQIANVLSYQMQWRSVAPSMDVVHSRIGRSANNLFGTQAVGGYDTFDAHVRMQLPNLPLQPEVSVDLNNIGDKRGIAGAYADPSLSTRDIYFITPRTLALTATLRL